MRSKIYFGSPFPGSLVDGYVNHDRVTFELLRSSPEICGSGRTEFWGSSVNESYITHHVENATVIAINEEPYDISLHGPKEIFLDRFDLRIEA